MVFFNINPDNRSGFPVGQIDKSSLGNYGASSPRTGEGIGWPVRGISFFFFPDGVVVKHRGRGSIGIKNDRSVTIAESGGMCAVRVHDGRRIAIVKSSGMRPVRIHDDRRVAIVESGGMRSIRVHNEGRTAVIDDMRMCPVRIDHNALRSGNQREAQHGQCQYQFHVLVAMILCNQYKHKE